MFQWFLIPDVSLHKFKLLHLTEIYWVSSQLYCCNIANLQKECQWHFSFQDMIK